MSAAGRPALSPDGALVVVPVVRPDLDADAYTGGLWVLPIGDTAQPSEARRLTAGFRDTAPAISPDGTRVAFLRAGEDSPAQICLVGLSGGEPVVLTDHPVGAGAPVWSPDGTRLAYTARVPEPGRYGTEDAEGRSPKPDAEAPRLITQPAYRRDNLGFTRDRRAHVFVLDLTPLIGSDGAGRTGGPGGTEPSLPLTARQLTDGDVDDDHPVWSPDGSRVAFVSARHDSRETDLRSGIHVVPAGGGEVAAVVEGDLGVGAVQWLPDGRLVFTAGELGPTGTDFVGRPTRLWLTTSAVDHAVPDHIAVDDAAVEVRALTGPEADLDAADGADLLPDGDRVIVREQSRGAVRLLGVDLADGSTEILLDGHLVVSGHAGAGSTLVVTASTPDRAGDVALVRGGEPVWLTDLSARLREAGLRPVQELVAPTGDGHEVHGWLVLPDPEVHGNGPHPVLLNIHGGPYAQYDWGLFDEYQVYAGAGYAVLQCNPRGSAGYGPEHSRSIRHAMGTVDADDVLAFLDHALTDSDSTNRLDQTRVGVMGGSYGGYMTALLTTRTDRFAAAVVERGYLDGTTFVGSSDIGWFFPGEYHGSTAAMREQSPMAAVDRVRTPTMVIHSEQDWRCPVEQGQRWFTALRGNGVRTELLLFPGEGHELSRSGRPRHRRQRFEHILRWWQQNLPVESTAEPAEQRAVEVRIGGSVQGVSFRAFAAREAVRLELTGWVRNADDGSVLGHVEGPADAVEEMLDWCHRGSPAAHVRQVDVRDVEPAGATEFTIEY